MAHSLRRSLAHFWQTGAGPLVGSAQSRQTGPGSGHGSIKSAPPSPVDMVGKKFPDGFHGDALAPAPEVDGREVAPRNEGVNVVGVDVHELGGRFA